MSRVGILAYGSLIDDPGKEISPIIREKVPGVETPFPIEFARSSSTRDGAPTLVPVKDGGASVRATILMLDVAISHEKAADLLWRRETRKECTDEHYVKPSNPDRDKVVVCELRNFLGLDTVLYTRIGANIDNLTPAKLAELAISSAKKEAGATGRDGISYLISMKNRAISTPLMPAYERAIMERTGAQTLEEALMRCRSGDL